MRAFRILAGLGFALLIAVTLPLQRVHAAGDPSGFINDLGVRVLKLLQDKQAPETARKQQFEQLAAASFDMPKIARFALGRYWATANDAERQQFTQAFEHYMVGVYWSRFRDYSGETFSVTGTRLDGDDATLVTTQVSRPNGQPPARVDWSVTKDGNGFKIRDVSIEGVSQALTYRQEFAAIIERGGGRVSAVTDELRQKANG